MDQALYGTYLFLAVFAAGNMTTLQIQHYGIYPSVGKEAFQEYIRDNNKAALVPSILPAMALLAVSLILLVFRPAFMSGSEAALSFALNIVALVSTFVWQRKLQGEMAISGYDESKVKLLNSTNWIRTIAFLVQAGLAVGIVLHAAQAVQEPVR